MGDLLAAAGLLVGVVGLLYGVWYPEISAARAIDPRNLRPKDAKAERDRISAALWGRAAPLAVAAILLSLVLLPDSIGIVMRAFGTIGQMGLQAVFLFDAVQACFLLVELFAVALAINLGRAAVALRSAYDQLKT